MLPKESASHNRIVLLGGNKYYYPLLKLRKPRLPVVKTVADGHYIFLFVGRTKICIPDSSINNPRTLSLKLFQFYFLSHLPSTNYLKSNWNETEVGIISHGSNLILVHSPSHMPGAFSKVAKASQKT